MVTLDNYYQIYLDKVMSLAKTIVIKSDIAAQKLNNGVRLLDPNRPIEQDKSTWRYYLNICGEYHWSNKVMEVVSMDTLETIVFNKENLKLHRATLKEYQFGTRRYEELVTRFPGQELLILGILYPADMDKALQAVDGTILSYPPRLVEFNEYTFINQLQEWIFGYQKHHTVSGYSYTDDLYLSANLGLMYLNLVPAIMTIRKRMCKTNEAHSYHVRQYLASHGFLDDYLDVMTTKQALRFYQNINWIERNIGKSETQAWLIREVMTARNLPIAEYAMRHDVEDQLGNLYPKVIYKKTSINGLENLSEVDNLTFQEMIDKELPLSPGNNEHFLEFQNEIHSGLVNSLSNVLQTKVLESKVTDYSNQKAYKLEDTLLNTWIDLAGRGIYKAIVHVNHPITGERLPLPVKQAFILYFYAYWKSNMDIDLPTVPLFYAERVPRPKVVTLEDLKKPLPKDFKDQHFLEEVLEVMPQPTELISIEAFYDYAKELNKVSNLQHAYTTIEEDLQIRAWKEIAVAQMYCDKYVQLNSVENQTYKEWFISTNIETYKMDREAWGDLAKAIFEEATGMNLNNILSLRAIHSAMVRLMIQLSSYSVQYLKEINDADALVLDFTGLREGEQHVKSNSSIDVPIDIDGLSMNEKDEEFLGFLFDEPNEDKWEVYETESSTMKMDDQLVDVFVDKKSDLIAVKADASLDGFVTLPNVGNMNPRGSDIVPGIEEWLKLPLIDQAKLKDVWGRDYWYLDSCDRQPNQKDPLSWYILSPNLNGFDYQDTVPLKLKDLNGFDYIDTMPLKLKDLNGFDYIDTPAKTKLDLGDLDGFSYTNQLPQPKDETASFYYVTPDWKPSDINDNIPFIKSTQSFEYHGVEFLPNFEDLPAINIKQLISESLSSIDGFQNKYGSDITLIGDNLPGFVRNDLEYLDDWSEESYNQTILPGFENYPLSVADDIFDSVKNTVSLNHADRFIENVFDFEDEDLYITINLRHQD